MQHSFDVEVIFQGISLHWLSLSICDMAFAAVMLGLAHILIIQMVESASCWDSPWIQQIIVLVSMLVHYS
jgi:hypothetical protein